MKSDGALLPCLTKDTDITNKFRNLLAVQDTNALADLILDALASQQLAKVPEIAIPVAYLRQAWEQEYTGPALQIFQKQVQHLHNTFDDSLHYAKVLAIVQSSGVGKSRLVDEFSKRHLGVVYTLRGGDESGYPPGDIEISTFLLQARQRNLHHAGVIALFSATFNERKHLHLRPIHLEQC